MNRMYHQCVYKEHSIFDLTLTDTIFLSQTPCFGKSDRLTETSLQRAFTKFEKVHIYMKLSDLIKSHTLLIKQIDSECTPSWVSMFPYVNQKSEARETFMLLFCL